MHPAEGVRKTPQRSYRPLKSHSIRVGNIIRDNIQLSLLVPDTADRREHCTLRHGFLPPLSFTASVGQR